MIELILDYVIENKYIVGLFGFLLIRGSWRSWKVKRLKKEVLSLQRWCHKLYSYLQEGE